MDELRQKTQDLLAFMTEAEGEAQCPSLEGSEAFMAENEDRDPTTVEQWMWKVVAAENIRSAWARVKANNGCAGVDGLSVEDARAFLNQNWPKIRAELLLGTYHPLPVKRSQIPKPGGGFRKLGIPAVVDRLIQQALLQILQPEWDPTFSESSFGFRPKRSAHQAVSQAQRFVQEGYCWVVDIDLEQFFDRVNHDRLMARVAERLKDKTALRLIRRFLESGVMDSGLVKPTTEGTPQGGPLSPLLSNLVLDELDRELERRGHRFARYADDCNIYVRSVRAGHRVMASLTRYLEGRLRLKVNDRKSAIDRPSKRKFLGFRLYGVKTVKRGISPESIRRFKDRVKELTRRTQGRSQTYMLERLILYLRGWRTYYGFCQTPSVLEQLSGWMRRRIRLVAWFQWKTGRRRYKALREMGVPDSQARPAAGSHKGPWRISNLPALKMAFSSARLQRRGLPSLTCTGV